MAEAAVKAAKVKAQKPPKQKGLRIPYERRKAIYGYGFLTVWILGTLYFFISPLVVSLWYSLNETAVTMGKMQTTFIGIQNYIRAFTEDTQYTEALLTVLKDTLWKTPIIIIFSIFTSVILVRYSSSRLSSRPDLLSPLSTVIWTPPVTPGDLTLSQRCLRLIWRERS